MNARRYSSRPLRKAPLFLGLAVACASVAAQAAERDPASRLEQRLGEHRAALLRQLDARLVPPPTRATGTAAVTNCDDSGPGSLRDAVASAVTGDVVDLSALDCSAITLTSGALATAVYDLTLQGPGADLLAIDGGAQDRIIEHTGYGTLTVSGLALRNGSYTYDGPGYYGSAAPGGCILSSGSVTIENGSLDQCSAHGASVFGGAIHARGALRLTGSTITGTTSTAEATDISATSYGGVVYAAATYLTDSTISGATISVSSPAAFSGALGGGAFGFYGVAMIDSTITGVHVTVSAAKDAYAKGGGVASPATVIMVGSTVSDNSVHGTPGFGASGNYVYSSAIGGGGVYIAAIPRGLPVQSAIANSTISGNSAIVDGNPGEYTLGGGGGVVSWSPLALTIANSTVSGNEATLGGGGLYTRHGGALSLSNATVTNNTSATGGGIVDAGERSVYDVVATSSIVAGNHSADNNEIVTMHAVSGSNNLIASANVALPADTLTGDPLLGPLADNGGATLTHALLAGSPAIDTGSNPAGLETDQRGAGFARVSGAAADIGAYEAQPLADAIFADGFDGP